MSKLNILAAVFVTTCMGFGAFDNICEGAPIYSKNPKAIYSSNPSLYFEGKPAVLANHKLYQVVDLKGGYKKAALYAKRVGGHLAIVKSKEESRMLRNFLKWQGIKFAYIGIEDNDGDGVWKDVNGKVLDFTYWHRGEPIGVKTYNSYAMIARKHKDGTWLTGPFSRLVEGYRRGTAFIVEWDKEMLPNVQIKENIIVVPSRGGNYGADEYDYIDGSTISDDFSSDDLSEEVSG